MSLFEAQKLTSVEIEAKDEILQRALMFQEFASSWGLKVLPWHNLGSPTPMTTSDGEFLCSSVFGWTGEEEWWHGLARRRMCPLADLCRYQTEPFWGTVNSDLESLRPAPYLDEVDLDWMRSKTDVRAILVVPVHMHRGQVGLVGFVSNDEDFDFRAHLDQFSALSHSFLSSYARVWSDGRKSQRCEPLSAREIDCLAWAFDGKTDRDIAEITGRSYATVRFYISSAAAKLNTVNRAQTLAKAATLGYFAVRA